MSETVGSGECCRSVQANLTIADVRGG